MSLPNRSSSASLEPQQCSAGPADATADSPTATLSALARPASGSSASTAQEELSDGGSAENAAAEAVAAEADANGVSKPPDGGRGAARFRLNAGLPRPRSDMRM